VDGAESVHLARDLFLLGERQAGLEIEGRMRFKRVVRVAVAHALYHSGVLRLWQAVALRRRAVVLMYHRVLTAEERRRTGSHPGIVVDRETFARQMAFLKRRFVVLPVEEFADRLRRGVPFPDSSCLITFDDGWRDNDTNALPILRQYGLPALVFLPVNYIGRRKGFRRETLTHLLVRVVAGVRQEPERRPRFERLLAPAGLSSVLDLRDEDPRASIVEIVAAHPDPTGPVLDGTVEAIAGELGVSIDELDTPDGFLDWDQVAAMSRQGVAFGGHGAEHRLLTRIPHEEAEAEIRVSKDVLDTRVGGAVPAFSYPNGNWTPQVARDVRMAGYRLAFTTEPGFVRCGDDPFALRRLNVHEDVTRTMPMFLARILGVL